ncbi:AAA family ATPase [Candidatus Kaiserbacteria bacterium]|nr:AAA family ATPase [Candidatus Kaiserbacteria bacterium]
MEWLIIIGLVIFFAFQAIRSNNPGKVSKTKIALARQGIGARRSNQRLIALEKPDIAPTAEMKKAINLLENTKSNVFLTGKAGTGKSTFLKYFRATTKKNVVVIAPTGVAALNVQGQTIHSFFHFGIDITPDTVRRRYGDQARIYKNIDMIIIDEISMVRADLFDCIDRFMRLNGRDSNLPFGGAQIFVIGDLFQLPPIVKGEEERRIFRTLYRSPFFFDSEVYQKANFKIIELTQTYRQTDRKFIDALDAVRVADFTSEHLNIFNARFLPEYERSENEFIISLVTKNDIAQSINISELAKLSAEPRTYYGRIEGDFREKDLPTDLKLGIKEGTQVMLLRNDPNGKWVNGDLAKVIRTDDLSVRVLFEDGSFADVGPQIWEAVRFTLNDETNRIQAEIVGTFTQIPVKLAWAVTIHKGQGKTFDRVHIEMGNGAFEAGQTYVALSRCRTLEGTILSSPIEPQHIFAHDRVKEFTGNLE